MSADVESARKALAATIQSTHDTDTNLDGAVLIGFVALAEWMAPDGERWLSQISGVGDGEQGIPDWQRQGYLHNALHDWPNPNGTDDEDV